MPDETGKTWRCGVCGYVHHGDGPPEVCPICGALAQEFEAFEPPHAARKTSAPNRWRCLNCSYIHEGPEPPEECPVCGAPADQFEEVSDEAESAHEAGKGGRVVIVGAGIAGVAAAEAIREASQSMEVVLLSRESLLPYYRLNLTRYLAGEIDDAQLAVHPAEWYAERRIDLRLECEAESIAPDDGTLTLRGGKVLDFDTLILTVGSHPFMPPFPGAYREGIVTFRTAQDAEQIREAIKAGRRCAIIGGGLLGLETAGAIASQGGDVVLLEAHEWLMPRQCNRRAGKLLEEHVRAIGIDLRTEARTDEIIGDERAQGIRLTDGTEIDADLIIVTTGIRTNSYLARKAGLDVNKGIVVDNRLATSHPRVLAAGDVAEHRGTVYGIWAPSQYMGSIAGMNAAGVDTQFGGVPHSNTLKVLGKDLFSIGDVTAADGSWLPVEAEEGGDYFRFVFHDNKLVGAILLGDTSLTTEVKKAVETGRDFDTLLKHHPTADDVKAALAED